MICIKLDRIWLSGSGEEDLEKISVYIYAFAISSPFRRAIPFV
jgi:hypothetical protein